MIGVEIGSQVRTLAIALITFVVMSEAHAVQNHEIRSTPLRIAVATNFAPILDEIAHEFTDATRIELSVITGSTGKLYAQIKNGMDVDLFLSADQIRVRRLVNDDLTISDTVSTYAEGRLVWWQPDSQQDVDWQKRLKVGSDVKVIAHAQPDLAPYGLAAVQALSKCFQLDRSNIGFVQGENVGQAYAYVATGNADAGLVALSNIKLAATVPRQSYSLVPDACHDPIKQDAVVLRTSQNVIVARRFLEFLFTEEIQQRIAKYGYQIP
ncbi:MAG: molybdate ABC transporter substrate-binding protein [Gammaproteobacteria bacterium]|nr:molybdate ABC transporter substrate-binding protein [Gammaproteobacteria bacterium]